ncbi:energy-coupling factor transporter transmembrane component T [Treponema phagedenis]|uniref:Energy-coupling factor transporter transmembrane protein EcfT n=1 Tax=Treponema phagedenis TaxID=162 RepID=A0AAE6M779_TREPH|nr:energy-coupling factor transporter transmembrane component T [Treponema phagedenis]NVP22889.1 energy-coupling factor transporter transmembrane protein EcfT [Treponema phagedenis]QEJ98308.1 energy-coupling factor transporter transmembrane protein EcfT [Treponema phagedenis]QKS92242.1 energy-coupling factor transporter transmembrane protein EcfT [Treponema phagedenis]QLC57788.1 energy-coupling factor transporter transmembrane protein EcfT [Treponema phagedenis]
MEKYEVYQPPEKHGFNPDPRTKILFMVFITTFMTFVHKDLFINIVITLISIMLLLSNRQFRTALIYGGLFGLAVIANFTKDIYVLPTLLNMISVLLNAVIIRLFPIFMLGYYVIKSTKTNEFIASMVKWHVSNNFIIPMAVAFRFIPTLAEEHRAIRNAMKMREIGFGTKRFWKNPGLLLEYVTIPLMVSVVKISDELSAAALTRGLGRLEKRTTIVNIKFGKHDFLFLLISIFLVVLAIYRR